MKQYYGVICDRNKAIAGLYSSRKEADEFANQTQDPDCNQETFSVVRGLSNIASTTGKSEKWILDNFTSGQ